MANHYKVIKGVSLEKALLDQADEHLASKDENVISLTDMQRLAAAAADGAGMTATERRTLAHIGQHYDLTKQAQDWFYKEFVPRNQTAHLSGSEKERTSLRAMYAEILADFDIKDKAELIKFLNLALALELTTIPLYLTSSYSVVPSEKDKTLAYAYTFSVAVEEMLHLGLVANMLVALGQAAKLYVDPADECSPFPVFPCDMPHRVPTLVLSNGSLTYDRVKNVFAELERPEDTNLVAFNPPKKKAEVNSPCEIDYEYESIGQFYETIRRGFVNLGEGIFENNADKQIPQADVFTNPRIPYFIAPTNDPDTGLFNTIAKVGEAEAAIHTIVEQGEGAPNSDCDLDDPTNHYCKFIAIGDRRLIPAGYTYTFHDNPKQANYPENILSLSVLFNGCYCYVLCLMEVIWNGRTDHATQTELLNRLYMQMNLTMNQVGKVLAAQKLDDTYHAAPTFEFYQFSSWDERQNLAALRRELIGLANAAKAQYIRNAEITAMLDRVIQVLSRTEESHSTFPTATGSYTWTKDIKPLITKRDIGNMAEYGIPVDSYEDWKNNAGFLGTLRGGRMPKSGPYFTREELGIIQKWVDDGYPK